jgi:hypothetical protein
MILSNKFIIIRKIKHGKEKQLQDWFALLNTTFRTEAVGSLLLENVLTEEAFCFQLSNEWYACGVMSSNGEIQKADMNLLVNQKHKKIMEECLEKEKIVGIPGYDIQAKV